jgi:20S proteasome subunit alpha 3
MNGEGGAVTIGPREMLMGTVEFATMTLHPETKQPLAKIYRPKELDELLQKYELGGTTDDAIGVGEGTGGGGGGEGNVSIST